MMVVLVWSSPPSKARLQRRSFLFSAMAEITLRVLDGADRGRVYDELQTPVTIGREEGNAIQLNDDRVSRYHIKIQIDHDKLVLTDLESTNGTKVNGEDIQLRILRFGDLIGVGRSLLLFGTREQIGSRLADLRAQNSGLSKNGSSDSISKLIGSLEDELNWTENPDLQATLHALQPPELPDRLSPGQAAQLSELLEYMHLRLRRLLATVEPEPKLDRVTLEQRQWQDLLDLQSRLATYLRQIGEP